MVFKQYPEIAVVIVFIIIIEVWDKGLIWGLFHLILTILIGSGLMWCLFYLIDK